MSSHSAVGYVEHLSVFGYGASGYLVALVYEVEGEFVVGVGGLGVFVLYEFFYGCFELSCGYLLVVFLLLGGVGLGGGS